MKDLREHLSFEEFTNIKRYNTHLVINEEGIIVSKYRKIHLFDIDLTSKGGIQLQESNLIERGTEITDPVYSPCGYLGLSISFDVRFPEMYRQLVMKGAQTLLVFNCSCSQKATPMMSASCCQKVRWDQ